MQRFLFRSYEKKTLLSDNRKSHLSRENFQACFQALSGKGGKGFALSKYSPVTFHYSPATAILNETRV